MDGRFISRHLLLVLLILVLIYAAIRLYARIRGDSDDQG
jgi:hypothetical protein